MRENNTKKNVKKILIIVGIIMIVCLIIHFAGPTILEFAKKMHGLD